MSRKFSRNIEDFACSNCGFKVKGTGYTDHCPKCLWSKHVDINPGDRESKCGGMMKPVRIIRSRTNAIIEYRCMKCGLAKRVKASKEDYEQGAV
jgi:lipopolysaccharide biosynthesis regulator YciM